MHFSVAIFQYSLLGLDPGGKISFFPNLLLIFDFLYTIIMEWGKMNAEPYGSRLVLLTSVGRKGLEGSNMYSYMLWGGGGSGTDIDPIARLLIFKKASISVVRSHLFCIRWYADIISSWWGGGGRVRVRQLRDLNFVLISDLFNDPKSNSVQQFSIRSTFLHTYIANTVIYIPVHTKLNLFCIPPPLTSLTPCKSRIYFATLCRVFQNFFGEIWKISQSNVINAKHFVRVS